MEIRITREKNNILRPVLHLNSKTSGGRVSILRSFWD